MKLLKRKIVLLKGLKRKIKMKSNRKKGNEK